MPPRIWTLTRASLSLFAARPVSSLALGSAIVVSLAAACCGLGVVAAPWFLCELFALQLSEVVGRPVERGRAWIGACAIAFGAVVLVGAVAWLALLGFGAEPPPGGLPRPATWTELAAGAGALASAAAIGALALVLPLLYAPLLLLDGKGNLGGALLESARLVARGGVVPHFALTLVAHAIQIAPPAIAALVAARLLQPDLAPLAILCSVPALAATVPLGQGMITAAYATRRADVVDRRRSRAPGRPPGPLVWLWALVVLTQFVAFAMLGASLARPSRLQPGRAPAGESLAHLAVTNHAPRRFHLRDTALEFIANVREVRIVAGDGGGVGTLPLGPGGAIERVRVVRVRDLYAVEVTRSSDVVVGWVDRAGVRLDDGLQRRLRDRVSPRAIAIMVLALVATALFLLPSLAGLAEVRRGYALPAAQRPAPHALRELRARTFRRATVAALALAPLAAHSLYRGLACLAP
jgi:hypothetical protein